MNIKTVFFVALSLLLLVYLAYWNMGTQSYKSIVNMFDEAAVEGKVLQRKKSSRPAARPRRVGRFGGH